MDIRITKPITGGTVRAIASKSEAHRILICAALAENVSFIHCTETSEDIDATAACLSALGARIERIQTGFHVTPILTPSSPATLNCGESGSTQRFLLPVVGALGVSSSFQMAGRLPSRPLTGLYEEMVAHGCKLSAEGINPLTLEGKLTSGIYTIPGDISSQFISGLLLALPLLKGDSEIRVIGTLESRPYVDITLDTLRIFGINIEERETQSADTGEENSFFIQGGQIYKSPKEVTVGSDWSNAALWLSAGAIIKTGITCTNLNLQSKQGDKRILDFLRQFGADVTLSSGTTDCKTNVSDGDFIVGLCEGSCEVSPATLRGIEIDASDTPDLVPILAAVASVSKGKTTIRNAERLRIKESDRLSTVTETLTTLGADITETADGLIIVGKERLKGGEVSAHGDHRIAMTAAVISAACENDVIIHNAEAVNKSYPAFFDDFRDKLGGEWDEVQ